MTLVGTRTGANNRILGELAGLSSSAVSRRHDSARAKLEAAENRKFADEIERLYWESRTLRIAELQA